MTVSFFARQSWKSGLLRERMLAEGLPEELQLKHSTGSRIERKIYECSEDLALAMLRDGADLEFVVMNSAILEYKKLNS